MRILLTILLIFAMLVGPVAAAGSCAAMAGEHMAAASGPAEHDADMSGMAAEDCAGMNAKGVPSHDPGCMAACALACPGFDMGPETANADAPLFKIAEYPSLATLIFVAALSHLDPPPPRV